jgi:hypothetical protein
MITEVTENKNQTLTKHVNPDVVFNRFDLLYGDDYELYEINGWYIPVKQKQDELEKIYLETGMYLRPIPLVILNELYDFLFQRYPKAEYIKIYHCYTETADARAYPYWRIDLPETKEEFDSALSPRVRYNTKWYPKIIRAELGGEIFRIVKYGANEITEEILKQFFDWKQQTHGWKYNKPVLEAIKEWQITSGYVLTIDDKIYALGFVCETGDNALFWNFSYDPSPEYKRYSLGMVVYYHIICDMINVGKKVFYLSGGWLDYKKWYNGVLSYTYSGHIQNPNIKIRRHRHHRLWWHLRHFKF